MVMHLSIQEISLASLQAKETNILIRKQTKNKRRKKDSPKIRLQRTWCEAKKELNCIATSPSMNLFGNLIEMENFCCSAITFNISRNMTTYETHTTETSVYSHEY